MRDRSGSATYRYSSSPRDGDDLGAKQFAHERAHLRGHHHLMLAVAAALARAFPAVPLLARAAAELAVLAEMTVGGPAAIARIQRLLAPPAPPGSRSGRRGWPPAWRRL
jgi:hypothetical protein